MDIPQLSPDHYAIHWPEPAHAKLEEARLKSEPCELELKNGDKAMGEVLHFTGRDHFFVFRPSRSAENHNQSLNVMLSNVRQIRLTRPVELLPLDGTAAGSIIQAASAVQVYNVEFADGEITSGETAGHVKLPSGLFLFFQQTATQVIRHFVPEDAIAYYQVGDPIGKVLIEENVVSEAQLKVAVEKQQEMRRLVLGDYLIEEGYITPEQLEEALDFQQIKPSLRLGEALIEMGFVTSEALQTALARQRANRGRPLGQILVDMGVLDHDTLTRMNAKKIGLPQVKLHGFRVAPEAVKLVSAETAHRLKIVPLAVEDGALIFATPQPPDTDTTSELGLVARMRVVPVIAALDEIAAKQREAYGVTQAEDARTIHFDSAQAPASADLLAEVFQHGHTVALSETASTSTERTLLAIVTHLLSGAVKGGTLDIHVDSEGSKCHTRISFKQPGPS